MLLWALFALMTAAVVAAVLRPLARPQAAVEAEATDVALYKAQIAEVEADVARGVIAAGDADLARREIARRLLSRADAIAPAHRQRAPLRTVTAAVALALPAAALGSYLWLGAPHAPDQPLAARISQPLDKLPVDELIARVEARLAQRPEDGQGWDVIAPVYFRLQRWPEAANAYARAMSLLGETPARLAGFAESTVMINNGIVTEAARLAYEKIRAAQPDRIEPRFWLALAKEQDGRRTEAAAEYRALLAAAPPDATWKGLVAERLAAVESSAPPTRGPTAADMEAASKLPKADQTAMIRGMVDSLAKRLQSDPSDADGWMRLVNAYVVLGERDKAVASLAEARRKLAANTEALAALGALAKSLGLGS